MASSGNWRLMADYWNLSLSVLSYLAPLGMRGVFFLGPNAMFCHFASGTIHKVINNSFVYIHASMYVYFVSN